MEVRKIVNWKGRKKGREYRAVVGNNWHSVHGVTVM